LSLIENGIDSEQFANGTPRLRELPGFNDKIIVGFVGRLAPEKGLPNLIQAVGEILRTRSDLVLALVGEGPAKIKLQSLVSQLGLEKSVFFLGQRSDLANVYASFDLFVLPSLFEAMPMAVLEAMAAGKPVIASRIGGVPRMLSHQESGILVEPGDVRGLTDALAQLLQQPKLASQLGRRALDEVRSRFSSDVMASGYLRVYQKALAAETSAVTPSTTTAALN
jgi:glycosyltransferase involved in cell wall biosynthesis